MAALIASCTNDDFLDVKRGQADVDLSKGIVFGIADEATTKGDFKLDAKGAFYTSWNAEIDKIGVVYTGVAKGAGSVADDKWCDEGTAERGVEVTGPVDLKSATAVYKTTRTGSSGYFTSASDNDLLKFDDAASPKKGSFRFYRPAYDVTAAGLENGASKRTINYACADGTFVETMAVAAGDFTTQVQPTTKANFANFFMTSAPIDGVHSSDNAVGESLELAFERPFSALAFKIKGYNKDAYGKLKSIEVELGTNNIASSDATVDIAKKDAKKGWVVTSSTESKKVTLKLADATPTGLEWSDDAWAFIQILPVNRTKAEEYTVTYTFENGTIVTEKTSSKSWEANSFYTITLDLEAEKYVYLATNNTLIVNSALPTIDASGNFNGSIAASSVETFVSNKILTKDELAIVKDKFEGVTSYILANESADLGDDLVNLVKTATTPTSLTLTKATVAPKISANLSALTAINCPMITSIPDGAYKNNTVITQFTFPKVQTIGDEAFSGATGATTIGCGTEKLIIGTTDLKTTAKTSALTSIGSFAFNGVAVTTVDAPALTTMGSRAFGSSALASITSVLLPKYNFADAYNAMALLGGADLATADLSSVDELGLTTISFAGNTNLATVTLKEGAKIGKSAFSGCTSLATVNKLDKATTIGENAFNGCTTLANVLVNTATIDANAFNGCTSLATVTLGANVKNIAEGAFSECTNLATVNNLATVEVIGKEAFKGTGIGVFDYLTATLGEGAFQSCKGLKGQVRSNVTVLEKNVFNGVDAVSTFVFPNVTTIKEGALQDLLAGTGSAYATITFGTALTTIDGKAFTGTIGGSDGSTAAKAKTGTASYNLIIADKTGLTIDNTKTKVTYKATDGKYYQITFQSVQ